MAKFEESKQLKFEVIQQMLNQILHNQQVKDPSHGLDSRPNKNSKQEVQQEQRPQFINIAANSQSTSIQNLKTNIDPDISNSDSSTQAKQLQQSSSTISEPRITTTKIEIQQIQKQHFNNIISTISKSTGINIDLESRDVNEKQPVIGKNGRREDQDQSRALSGLSIHVGTNPWAIQEEQPPLILDFNSDRVNAVVGGTEVGAFAIGEGECRDTPETVKNPHVMAAVVFDGDPRRGGRRYISPIVAKPPPLMAASFPWDRESGSRTVKKDEVAYQWKERTTNVKRRRGEAATPVSGVNLQAVAGLVREESGS